MSWFGSPPPLRASSRWRLAATRRHTPAVVITAFLLALFLLAGAGANIGARTLAATAAASRDQFSTRVDLVQLAVTVRDARGFVRGLPREAFHVSEDGVARPLVHFQAEQAPLEIVVDMDTSSSMRKAFPQVKADVQQFLTGLPPDARLTFVAFDQDVRVLARPGVARSTCVRLLDALAPLGRTSLYDVVVRSFGLLDRRLGRRVIVVFTDGEDTASRATCEMVEQRTAASDVVLYVIGQGRALESVDLREICARLARRSGGRAFFTRDAASLGEVFDAILAELSAQYFLAYAPRAERPDGKFHRIKVSVSGGRFQVRTREGYVYE